MASRCADGLEAYALRGHELDDGALRLGRELAVGLRQHVRLGEDVFGAHHLYHEPLGVGHLNAVLARGLERQHGLVVGIVHGHPAYLPIEVGRAQLVDYPHFGRERILAAKRDAEERPQHRQVLGVERVLARPELAHELPLAEEQRLLRFVDDELRVGAEVGLWKPVCKDELVALRFPACAINECHNSFRDAYSPPIWLLG